MSFTIINLIFSLFLFIFLPLSCFSYSNSEELIGKEAPNFNFHSLNSEDFSLKDFRNKIVLLNFWISKNDLCKNEMDFLKKVYEEYSNKDFYIISINLGENKTNVKKFIEENSIPWIVCIDENGSIASIYGVRTVPFLILIDEEGIIKYVYAGIISDIELKEKINSLISSKTFFTTIITTAITVTIVNTSLIIFEKTSTSTRIITNIGLNIYMIIILFIVAIIILLLIIALIYAHKLSSIEE